MPGTILSVNYDENAHLVVLMDPTRQIGAKNWYAARGFNKRERNQQKIILVLLCFFFGMKTNYFLLIFFCTTILICILSKKNQEKIILPPEYNCEELFFVDLLSENVMYDRINKK